MDKFPQTETKKRQPRLKPIENPKNLKVRLAYWLTERKMGTVLTSVKVLYARYPEALGLAQKIAQLDEKLPLDDELKLLVKTYVASLNGCVFCVDIARASAISKKLETDKFDDLMKFEESEVFTEKEKSALAFADEVTRNIHVSDATFERLRQYFTEEEIVQLTLLNAIENYYNLTAAPLDIGSDELCKKMNAS